MVGRGVGRSLEIASSFEWKMVKTFGLAKRLVINENIYASVVSLKHYFTSS
jgi:hypothetical protein